MKKYEPYKKLTTDELKHVIAGNGDACEILSSISQVPELAVFSACEERADPRNTVPRRTTIGG